MDKEIGSMSFRESLKDFDLSERLLQHVPAYPMKNKIDYETYSRNMRLELCDKDMILENGNINHSYFLVKKGAYWSESQ